jgi:hypothetical protein
MRPNSYSLIPCLIGCPILKGSVFLIWKFHALFVWQVWSYLDKRTQHNIVLTR